MWKEIKKTPWKIEQENFLWPQEMLKQQQVHRVLAARWQISRLLLWTWIILKFNMAYEKLKSSFWFHVPAA